MKALFGKTWDPKHQDATMWEDLDKLGVIGL